MLLDSHAERPAFLPNRWTELGQFFQGIFESAVSGDWSRCPKTFLVAVNYSVNHPAMIILCETFLYWLVLAVTATWSLPTPMWILQPTLLK